MPASKERSEAHAAARRAVGAYARYPTEANAKQVQLAVKRLRDLASAAARRQLQRNRRGTPSKRS